MFGVMFALRVCLYLLVVLLFCVYFLVLLAFVCSVNSVDYLYCVVDGVSYVFVSYYFNMFVIVWIDCLSYCFAYMV